MPHESTPPSTPYPTPTHSATFAAPSRTGVVFVVIISSGTLLITFVIWRGVVFYLRRQTAVRDSGQPQSPAPTIFTNTASSPSRTSQIIRHHPPSISTTLFSNVGVVQAEMGQASPVSTEGTMGITRRTEKWHALLYGRNRNSQ